MLEKDINDLLQDYKYRKNILEEITLDDIEKWNNMDVDIDWDKITNKPSTFTPSTHTHNFEDLLEKPTTLEGYGITDCYTKDEIQDNTLNKFKAINGKVLVDTGFILGVKDGDNLISYNYGTSGAPTVKFGLSYDSDMYSYIDSYLGKLDLIASGQIYIRTPYLNLKVPIFRLSGSNGSFSVDVSDNKGNNKLYASIPAEFTDIVKAPRLNIYSGNNTVLEGALWNSTYNINGEIKDGLHLSHENGKYLALAYKNASTGIYNSYMICDVEGVLRNDSDGDDWGQVRFEQNVFFRHGLKIGGGEDIILAGKGVNTRIAALENAITQGTGMVEWNNVLNKPSTFTPSSHKHAISDITSLQSALDGKASSTHNHDTVYSKLGHTHNYAGSSTAGGPATSAITAKYPGVIWTATTQVGTWSALCKTPAYISFILSISMNQNSQCGYDTFLVSTGWESARIYQLGGNGYAINSGYQLRLLKESGTQYTLEIKNDYGYNGAKTLDIDCRYIVTSHHDNIITYSKKFVASTNNAVMYSITTSPYNMVGTISNALKDSEGNIIKDTYLKRSGQNTANLNTCYDVGIYFYTNSATGAPNRQYGHILNTVSSGNKYNGSNNWLSQLAFNTDDTIWHRSKVNSGEWTNWTKLVKTTDLNNYLPKSGGTLTGDIILSNSTAIKGNISGTAQDLIKFGIYATQSESTLATIVGNSDNPTISLGKLYEKNYRVLNSNNFTSYCPSISDLSNYLPKSGGNVSGNIILNNTIKISSKDKGGTVRDLIWMNNTTNGEVVVGGGSNQVTFDIPTPKSLKIWCDGTQKSYEVYHSGNDPWRIKTLGKADMDTTVNSRGQGFLMKEAYNGTSSGYPKGYGNVLRMGGTGSNELFFEWCDGTAGMIYHRCLRDIGTSWTPWRRLAYADELSSYLPKSGGTMKGELALTQDKGIVSANVEGGTLLVETKSSVNVGKTTKNLNLNCSLAYMNGARVLTEYNYAYYVLPKTIFAGLFSPDKTIGTDSNAFYGYSKKTVYKSADCTVGTDRITISKAGIYKVTATWGGVPKSGTANTSAMRFTIQQKKSSAAIASKLDTITVTTLNRTAKSTVSYLFKCSANDYFIFFSYLCTVTFESEDVEIEIVRIS